ncbi:hypothetical protein MAR_018889 [Mya arenaria]|uniref:Uncharacterized protein n=1 Tax=Mya arenaria TaxID=6604 RepID=A0ABY7EJF8_MYAAR|nr:hypothetical protein MAR_018889 [Mya arenaria]
MCRASNEALPKEDMVVQDATRPKPHNSRFFKSFVFAAIGALETGKWLILCLYNSSTFLFATQLSTFGEEMPDSPDLSMPCSNSHLIDELTNRMQMLEVAFKEQVFARETIARGIIDQSDVYVSMDKKLEEFLAKMDNISTQYAELESKYKHLEGRIYSDEVLGVVMVLIVTVQLFCSFRRPILKSLESVSQVQTHLSKFMNKAKPERKVSSNPGTPKHSLGLRNEMCVICFQRDNTNGLISKLMDSMLRHLEGVKLSAKPFYAVFAVDDIRTMPHVKLYVVLVDLETRGLYINGSEKDLVLMALKFIKSIGAQCVVIISNDEGSRHLTAHSVYNSSIRMTKTNDSLQELASDGKLYSMWQEMTSHQLSHLRRLVKTVLNAKLVLK